MADIDARIQRTVEELMSNEALLEMLNWGITTAKSIISKAMDLDDFAAELALAPRLKAIRQSMRSIGNWVAGKYADPASRMQLREKLMGNFKMIFGEGVPLPAAEKMDEVLNQVDDLKNTPQQLILKLRELIEVPS